MLDFAFNGVAEGTQLLTAVAFLGVAAVVLITFLRTRALMPTLMIGLVGGVVVWMIAMGGSRWIGERIDDDATRLSSAPAVVEAGPDVGVVAT